MTETGRPSSWYRAWVASYRCYALRRGFDGPLDDLRFFRRAFIAPWFEPGFHRFWQTWNPGISYFVFLLYVRLGGDRRRTMATVMAFAGSGAAHNLLTLPWFQRWSWTLPAAFVFFGLVTVLSRAAEGFLRQESWPAWANALVNGALVIGGFDLGFRIDAAI